MMGFFDELFEETESIVDDILDLKVPDTQEVLSLAEKGLTIAGIASMLDVSIETVEDILNDR